MTLYIIGIGGTGSKCLEAITQVAATGLFTEEKIKLLFIDADETNGNLERSRSSLSIYQRTFDLMSGDKQHYAWLKTPLESYDVWSPFAHTSTNKNLSTFFNYNNLKQKNLGLGNLFDVLYTKEEQQANLDIGFRGRPAIGSGVMSRVDLDSLNEEPWSSIIGQIQADVGAGKSVKIFLCGSIFGGTGASGLPTIGRLLDNKLEKENVREKVKIACLFLLPYFGFTPKGGENKDEVYARSEQFLLNTEGALRYYVNQAKQFDTVYLLGNQNLSQFNFSIGKNTQRNETHFIEFYAALAARHFSSYSPKNLEKVVLISRENNNVITWGDLPQQEEVRAELVNATRFVYVWLGNIAPELEDAKKMGVKKFQNAAPWFGKFFSSGGGRGLFGNRDLPDFNQASQQEAIRVITEWCQDYLRWILDIHRCDGDDIKLFNDSVLEKLDGTVRGEELSELVVGDNRDKGSKAVDTVQRLKERLLDVNNITPPNQGTTGLAKALYLLCRL
jgi:hypothetical protein